MTSTLIQQYTAVVLWFLLQLASGKISLEVQDISYNSVRVNVTHDQPVQRCSLEAKSRYNSEDLHKLINITSGTSLLEGLRSNVIYLLKATCHFMSVAQYSDTAEARTYPNGTAITTSKVTPHYFTAFLQVIPGATEWILEWTDHSTGVTFSESLTDPYKIFLNVTADTVFSLRARVSRIHSMSLLESHSPFGKVSKVRTAPLSLFGRVTILGESRGNVESKRESWKMNLLNEYQRSQSLVVDVRIIEIGSSVSPNGALVHHEIYVNGTTLPLGTSLMFLNNSAYADQMVVDDVDPYFVFGIKEGLSFLLFVFDVPPAECTEEKKSFRTWVLNQHHGVSSDIQVAKSPDDAEISYYNDDSYIAIIDNQIVIWSGDVPLQPNTLYSIDHHHRFKTCLRNATDVSLYGIRRRASARIPNYTTARFNSTFMYSTEPVAVDVSKISYTVSDSLDTITIRMPSVYRADSYQLSIVDAVVSSFVSMTNLDSSTLVEASFSDYLPHTEYCLNITVIVKHPQTFFAVNNKSETCFRFFSGPPNATACRVVNVIENKFEVIYNPVTFATRYIIEVRNSTFITNYTTNDARFAISNDVTMGSTYDVRVAARNPFGISAYSPAKSTKFWNVTRVSNDTIELTWDKAFSDESYQVVTDPGSTPQVTGNSAIVSGLDSGVIHFINVSAVGVKRILLFSIKQITAPGTPTLEARKSSPYRIDVMWANLTGVDEYVVNISGRGVNQQSVRNTRPAEFSGLYSGVRYTVRASFHNTAGFSVTQNQFVTGFAVPSNISALSATNHSIDVSWDVIQGVLSYQVSAYFGKTSINNATVFDTFATVSNMEPGQNYSIIVTAKYDEGEQSSKQLIVTTAPATPTNIHQIGRKPNSILVSWDTVKSAEYYIIHIPELNESFPMSSTMAAVDRLEANCGYDIIVTAANSAGKGHPTKKRLFTEFLKPADIVATRITSQSMSLSWNASAKSLSFELWWRSDASNYTYEFPTKAEFELINLHPDTEYHFGIKSVYSEGKSNFTAEITFSTLRTTSTRTGIPWWIFLVPATITLVIGIAIVLRWNAMKSREAETGFYDCQRRDEIAVLDVVALEQVTLERVGNESIEPEETHADALDETLIGNMTVDDGHIGPQPSIPIDEALDIADEGAQELEVSTYKDENETSDVATGGMEGKISTDEKKNNVEG